MEGPVAAAMIGGGLLLRHLAGVELKRVGLDLLTARYLVQPPRIACEGVYRYMDHPAYAGSLLLMAGAGIACLGWGGAILALAAWPFYRVRSIEEDRLLREMKDA